MNCYDIYAELKDLSERVLLSSGSISLLFLFLGCAESDSPPTVDYQITHSVDTLQVVFEIGEEIGDSTNTFWSIVGVDIDDQGRIFVVDEIDASVKAYDLQGNYIQQVTRRGNGPGELQHPQGLCIMPDGRLVIIAPSKNGYVVFNDSLEFVEEVSLWLNNSPYHVSPLTNNKLVACRYDGNPETDAEWQTAAIYNWSEPDWETLLWKDSIQISNSEYDRDPSVSINFTVFHLLSSYGDGNGNVYFGQVDAFEYRVIGWDSTGTEILSITRDMTPVEKSTEEIASESEYMNYTYQRMGGSPSRDVHPSIYENMISEVGIGPDKNLWVRRGTHNELFFDIYNLEGNLLSHAVYPVESWSWEIKITTQGILAWELDPLEGFQKLYFLE
ncbi:MAG: 6-bladed beta-propeller [Candidatus Aegiribacteria sp.]|nr:6-bladed beta-propeller [Candidatus Aegiribacteria sp.]